MKVVISKDVTFDEYGKGKLTDDVFIGLMMPQALWKDFHGAVLKRNTPITGRLHWIEKSNRIDLVFQKTKRDIKSNGIFVNEENCDLEIEKESVLHIIENVYILKPCIIKCGNKIIQFNGDAFIG